MLNSECFRLSKGDLSIPMTASLLTPQIQSDLSETILSGWKKAPQSANDAAQLILCHCCSSLALQGRGWICKQGCTCEQSNSAQSIASQLPGEKQSKVSMGCTQHSKTATRRSHICQICFFLSLFFFFFFCPRPKALSSLMLSGFQHQFIFISQLSLKPAAFLSWGSTRS